MNKRQTEVEKAKLAAEENELKHLKAIYSKAASDISKKISISNGKINVLLADFDDLDEVQKSILQSQIYQRDFQKSLQKQIDGFLKDLNDKQYQSVDEYLKDCYTNGYIGTMYDIAGQGIPFIIPIDQKQVTKAMTHDTKLSKRLYTRLGEDVDLLKKRVANNISRGIATADGYANIARNIANGTNVSINRTMTIARTEGHRIQVQATDNAQHDAKDKGADVVKQWDSTLDGKTRPHHRQLDGQIRELDEPFEVDGMKVMYPSDFGKPGEDINCRCALLQRARWALGEEELETLKERAAYFGLDKTKDFEDYKKKYLKAEKQIEELEKEPVSDKVSDKKKIVENHANKEKTIDDINNEGTNMVREIYERHRIRNNLNQTPIDKLTEGGFENIMGVKYGKMSVESAEIFNNTIKSLSDKYDTSLINIRPMKKDEYFYYSDSFAFVYHDYSTDSATLAFNTSKLKDVEKLSERIKELGEYGYCVKVKEGYEAQYVATHEFAHTLINIEQSLPLKKNWVEVDFSKIKKCRKEIKTVYEDYLKEVKETETRMKEIESKLFDLMEKDIIDEKLEAEYNDAFDLHNSVKISDYSLGSIDEFMAEGFTDSMIGENPSKYSTNVREILEKYFKR